MDSVDKSAFYILCVFSRYKFIWLDAVYFTYDKIFKQCQVQKKFLNTLSKDIRPVFILNIWVISKLNLEFLNSYAT